MNKKDLIKYLCRRLSKFEVALLAKKYNVATKNTKSQTLSGLRKKDLEAVKRMYILGLSGAGVLAGAGILAGVLTATSTGRKIKLTEKKYSSATPKKRAHLQVQTDEFASLALTPEKKVPKRLQVPAGTSVDTLLKLRDKKIKKLQSMPACRKCRILQREIKVIDSQLKYYDGTEHWASMN